MTILLEAPVHQEVGSDARPVHIPEDADEMTALCGVSLVGKGWTTREPDCPDCLVLNELRQWGSNPWDEPDDDDE